MGHGDVGPEPVGGSCYLSADTLRTLSDGVLSLDRQGTVVAADEQAAQAFGCAELVGRTLWEAVPDTGQLERLCRQALEDGLPVEFEQRLGQPGRLLAIRAHPSAEGLTLYCLDVCGRAHDERARLAIEAALAVSERRRQLAFDAVAVGMMVVTPGREIVEANPALGRMLGYEPQELAGKLIEEVTHPDEVERVAGRSRRLMQLGANEGLSYEKRYVKRDGTTLWARVGLSAARSAAGDLEFFVCQIEDISALKQTERELAETRHLYELVIESAPDLIAVGDLDGTIRLPSRSFEPVLGYTPDELIGRNIAELLPPGAVEDGQHWLQEAGEGDLVTPDLRFLHKDGTVRLLEGRATIYKDERGDPAGLIMVARDVTEERKFEEQLRHSQKLEAVGELAGGVAHDFNNLLTGIYGYGALALEHVESDPAACRNEIRQIAQAATRARELTAKLLAFGRKQTLAPQLMSLNDLVAETEPLLRRLLPTSVEIKFQLEPELGLCLLDPGSLQQVLINLCVNARDAMPTGGKLRIETRNETAPAHLELGSADHVALLISDNGQGMDEVLQARIFEPFFTTKELGKGTGLGLATSYGIIRQSGGAIGVESAPGGGSTFSVYLPRQASAPATSTREAGPAAAPARAPGVGTVLVVEDEDLVRRLLTLQLSEAGYTVLAAGSGAEALELAAGHEFDLLVTDIMMPGMNGIELHARLTESRPGLKTVFTSGYSADALEGKVAPESTISTFLEKPYTGNQLLEKIHALSLSEAPGSRLTPAA